MHLTAWRSLATRRVTSVVAPAPVTLGSRAFHPTSPALVKVGDRIPDLELVEGSPGDKVNLSKELKQGKGVIIGVPAAFSKSFSITMIVPLQVKDNSARKN